MVAVQASGAPTRPPSTIEDFLWNIHSVLAGADNQPLDTLKEAYSKKLGHKCAIERFLVVGEGGLAATLKRIPHIVTTFQDSNGTNCVKATLGSNTTKEQLVEADQAYRKELTKRNIAAKALNANAAKAKAKAVVGSKPAAPAAPNAKAPSTTATASGSAQETAKSGSVATATNEGKRPADVAKGGDAKRQKTDSDGETLAKMLVQGVVRVLQNRAKEGLGPLPLDQLESEFQSLWKVPFNLQQAGEQNAQTFLQKWPNKVELKHDGTQYMVSISKKAQEKAKAASATKAGAAAPSAKASEEAAATKTATATPAAAASTSPSPGTAAAAKTGSQKPSGTGASAAAAAAKAPAASTAPEVTSASGAKASAPAIPKAGNSAETAVGSASAAAKVPSDGPPTAKNGPAIPKRVGGPTRPPSSIEDFLWNIHSVLDAFGAPLPIDQLKEAYSKHLGHKCSIERFLVVGEGGLAATLKRIPHVVTVVHDKDGGTATLKATQAKGTTREGLVAADQNYRRQLQQKNLAAKAAAKAKAEGASAAAAPTGGTSPGAASAAAPVASPAKAPAATPGGSSGQKRAAADTAGEQDSKKLRTEDADTLTRMLIQGVVRVLQNRAKENKGPLLVSDLETEFTALWKVPFNLQPAGETDVVTFLQKWPKKVEIVNDGTNTIVQLAEVTKKAAEKAKATPAATKTPPAQPKASAQAGTSGDGVGGTSPAAPTASAQAAPPAKSPSPGAASGTPGAATTPPTAASGAGVTTASTSTEGAQASARTETSTSKDASQEGSQQGAASAACTAENGESAETGSVSLLVSESSVAEADLPRTLPEMHQHASAMLKDLREMVKRQECFVDALSRLGSRIGVDSL